MTPLLIFGQHSQTSYTGTFGITFWHPHAGICLLRWTVMSLQTEQTLISTDVRVQRTRSVSGKFKENRLQKSLKDL